MENDAQGLLAFQKDVEWVGHNLKHLQEGYQGEFIAVRNGRIVDHDRNIETLVQRLRGGGEEPADMVIEFVFGKDVRLFL
ncbi:MAG: hypothetical protein HY520_01035 [Candidatus Aenigmarchaeota archaeon]|nr:hypothetical protein [Candidatus Aenigmarchaeota archaeon]